MGMGQDCVPKKLDRCTKICGPLGPRPYLFDHLTHIHIPNVHIYIYINVNHIPIMLILPISLR